MEGTVLTVAFVALLVAKVVDTIRNFADPNDSAPKGIWNLAAFGIGVVSAFIAHAAGFEFADGGETVVLTGFIIGATASGWHEVLDRLSP